MILTCTYKFRGKKLFLEVEGMGKYANDAKMLLKHIGGKDNISAVSHCATRMRFVLNDSKKADIENIEKIVNRK